MTTAKKFLSVLFTGALASTAAAADYYVAPEPTGSDGNAGSAEAPFATIDKAISVATEATDVIHVEPGTYTTTAQWGPNLKAKLIGAGASRDDVIIQSAGTYRTLRMADGSMVTNVTVVGILTHTSNADKGGSIEMSGGTLVDCVVRDGHSNYASARSGGNIFMTAGLVENCVISNGNAKSRGGNINMEGGTVRNCLIADGQATAWGGNVYVKGAGAVVTNCTIIGGKNTDTSANNAWGGNVNVENAGTVVDCIIRDGTSLKSGGNVFMSGGTLADCTISGGTALGTTWEYGGGNIYINGGATISRCDVSGGNGGTGEATGGGIRCRNSSGVIEDCLVHENDSGICLDYGSAYNCTVVKNTGYGLHGYTGAYAKIQNCVVFGNSNVWSGKKSSTADAIVKIAVDDATGFGDEATSISASDFADYANGDYRPALASALIDAGKADPRGESASTTDLLGNPRLSGLVDIGCYEYQKTTMSVDIALADSAETVYAPGSVTFNVTATGYPAGQTPTFTVNFGDGSAEVETTDTQVVHEFTTAGKFTVTVQASAAGAFDAQGQLSSFVQIASKTIYVKAGNESPTFPYNTPETGYATVQAAYANAVDGSEIIVGAGTYDFTGQMQVTNAVAIRGVGANPGDVVFQNTKTKLDDEDSYQYRVLEVNNAGARIENITIQNGRVQDQYGANLRLVSGVVSNCVIRGGIASVVGDNANAAGGGVEIAGEATLTHCVISNNVVNGTSDNAGYTGGAVFIAWKKQKARISNCLIAYNRYITTSGTEPKAGAAGIHFGGGNDYSSIENCTVVSNVVDGALADDSDSAGIHCTTWYGRLRNNIVLGNYETGKGKFTAVKMDTEHGTYVGNITEAEADHVGVFRDFANGDFGIKPFSAAYGAGTIAGLVLAPSVDLAGAPRVQFDRIDAGCYECQVRRGICFIVK